MDAFRKKLVVRLWLLIIGLVGLIAVFILLGLFVVFSSCIIALNFSVL